MKFTLSWLRDHLETDASLEQICDRLSVIGLEVESVEEPGRALAPFRTGRILSAARHPNADRLQVCRVDAGAGFEDVQVVCGAPNAREGLNVIFAPPGTWVPGLDITIKAGKIRGEESGGMLCSLRELGLGEESDGIAELPPQTPVGQSYGLLAGLDDPIIEIAITPNRGDALSVRGIARDLAASGLGQLKPLLFEAVEGSFNSPISWRVERDEDCPWVLGRYIRGVRNGPSPEWLQKRLKAVGVRPISALVDITNYFTFDLGRPLHVFDADLIMGNVLTICRGQGETFNALNEKDYVVTPEDCVIADAAQTQSLAGVMGGAASSVSDNTVNVFVECALFDPIRVALAGRRHHISSDARQRFERGVDQAFLPSAMEGATRMIMELCGGQASEVTSTGAEPAWQRTARLRFERLRSFGGIDITADESISLLEKLGFTVKARSAEAVEVHVPSWRNDIASGNALSPAAELSADKIEGLAAIAANMEAESDLIEEIIRLKGIDTIPGEVLPPLRPVPAPALSPRQARTALVRRALAVRGLSECVNFSFTSHDNAARFGEAPIALQLLNPIAADLNQLRPTPLASLVVAVQRNAARGFPDIGLFEIGPGFVADKQLLLASGIRCGHAPRYPGGGGEAVSVWQAKADALAVLESFDVSAASLTVETEGPAHYHPGRSGVIRQGPKTVLGYFGQLHPALLKALGLDYPVVGFEIFLDRAGTPRPRRRKALHIPDLQPLHRDFAFIVPQDVPADKLLAAVRNTERNLIINVSLFDVYEGDKVPLGHKSLAVEVTVQPRERSLTDAEIEALSQKIIEAAGRATGAVLR